MANSTHTRTTSTSFDSALHQVQEASEQFLAAARKAGSLYLDSYEKTIDRAINLELSMAEASQQEWLKSLIAAQADVARELTSSYTAAARAVLK
jgi:hypothetical protein